MDRIGIASDSFDQVEEHVSREDLKMDTTDGEIWRERSTWDVPKDTELRYDKSAGLQWPTMCGMYRRICINHLVRMQTRGGWVIQGNPRSVSEVMPG